jgi:ferredoxin
MLIAKEEFNRFIEQCAEEGLGGFDQVILTKQKDDEGLFLMKYSEEGDPALTSFRPHDPLRNLFYFAREKVYPFKKKPGRRLVVGAKACDLRALNVVDKALINEDFVDPVYQAWREQTYIISADCEEIGETCHCTLMDGKPYAEEFFDLNIASYGDRYLIEVGSERGEELMGLVKKASPLKGVSTAARERVDRNRRNVIERLEHQNEEFDYGPGYKRMRKVALDHWVASQDECVGCGACTNICPTCYCLILNDESIGDEFVKVRSTDSCQLHGYSLMAGGDTPRPQMRDRFRNRYLCKFDYMQKNFDEYGCVGCGRCIDACPGEIDLREVVAKILASPIQSSRSPS